MVDEIRVFSEEDVFGGHSSNKAHRELVPKEDRSGKMFRLDETKKP